MATMNINLPDEMRVCVDALVSSGQFQSNSEYIRELIRDDLRVRAGRTWLQQELEAGMKGPFRVLDESGLMALKHELTAVIGEASDATTGS